MAKIFAILNQKGGVGKTTVTVNLGHALALAGKRVLLLDTDSQDNVALWFGYQEKGHYLSDSSLFEVLVDEEPIEKGIFNVRENLDICPSGGEFFGAIPYIFQKNEWPETRLKEILETIKDKYDYILIDTSPSRSLIHTLVLHAAEDGIIVPVNMEWLAVFGSKQVQNSLKDLMFQAKVIREIRLVVPTFIDRRRSRQTDDMLENLKFIFKDKLGTPIRVNSKISEAPEYGQTVYDINSKRGIEDFDELKELVMELE